MRVSHISIILSKAKDLVFSATYEDEILRLRLRMTVATLSHYAGEERGGGPKRLELLEHFERFELHLCYVEQPFDVARHDQSQIFDFEL